MKVRSNPNLSLQPLLDGVGGSSEENGNKEPEQIHRHVEDVEMVLEAGTEKESDETSTIPERDETSTVPERDETSIVPERDDTERRTRKQTNAEWLTEIEANFVEKVISGLAGQVRDKVRKSIDNDTRLSFKENKAVISAVTYLINQRIGNSSPPIEICRYFIIEHLVFPFKIVIQKVCWFS